MSSASTGGLASLLRRPVVLLALALLVLAALISLIGSLSKPKEAVVKPLSQEAGTELYAALSPDGTQLAYSGRASSGEDSFHIFVRNVNGGGPRQLTRGTGSDVAPVWSPDGARLAFARMEGGQARYIVAPAAGGTETTAAQFEGFSEAQAAPSASWTHDGASLAVTGRSGSQPSAILLVPAAGGTPKPLTSPPEGSEGDTTPAFSPDGASLAFVRRTGPEGADIWMTDLNAAPPRRVTFDDHLIRGLAWTPTGAELVYASNRARGWRLWRVPAGGGSPREINSAGKQAQYPTVGARGGRMVYSESPNVAAIWRTELDNPAAERSLIRSSGRETLPTYSPDGTRIAYVSDQSGADEIWIAGADGGNPMQITSLKAIRVGRPRWSPDGRTVAFDLRQAGPPEIYVVPAAPGGKPRQLTRIGASSPSWSHDGKWIYFGQRQIWRMAPDGTGVEQLTRRGGSNPVESPDGKWIYYHRAREIRRIPAGGGAEDEEAFYQPNHNLIWGSLVPAAKGLYFMEWDFGPRTASIAFLDFATRAEKSLFTLKRADFDRGASFDLSPDAAYVIYSRMDQTETNLMLVEGFR